MEFIITKELRPTKFAKKEYEYPKNSYKEQPLEWVKYWKKCLKDSGLDELKLITDTNGSCLIDLSDITDNDLEIILTKELKKVNLDKYEDEILPFDGGLVIKDKMNKTIIQPQCCGDLGNIKDWLDINNKLRSQWTKLWIGHPWIFIKRNRDNVELSNYNQYEEKNSENIKMAYKINSNTFTIELNELAKKQNQLKEQLGKVLAKMEISHSKAIGKLLAGNF